MLIIYSPGPSHCSELFPSIHTYLSHYPYNAGIVIIPILQRRKQAQRGWVTCVMFHSKQTVDPGLTCMPPGSMACAADQKDWATQAREAHLMVMAAVDLAKCSRALSTAPGSAVQATFFQANVR